MRPALRLQVAFVVGAVAILELLTRLGVVPRFTMIPPSEMALGLYDLFASGRIIPDLRATLIAVAAAAVAAVVSGFLAGAVIHRLPQLRRTLDPVFGTYYAVPIWSFYPLFVVLFGLTDAPKMIIGYLYAVVAMIINTLNGLDRVPNVLRKTARVLKMGKLETDLRIMLPYAVPYIFTGVKLAVAYAFIGVVGSEFILSTAGLGYQISYAYNEFDNVKLYATILLIVVLSVLINVGLFWLEGSLMRRRTSA
jgi:NitT/TauT family transport system permease protein